MRFDHIAENLRTCLTETGNRPLSPSRVLGFTLIRAWVYLMFVGAAASSMTWSGDPIPPLFYVVSTGSLCAVLFGSAVAGQRFVALMLHPAARLAAPVLTTAGTLLLASSAGPSGAALSCGLLGAITTGLGSGAIDLGYGELYRNEPPIRTTLEVPLAFFLAAVVFSIVALLPSPVGCAVCALLPAVSGWILFADQHAWSRRHRASVLPIDFDLKSFAWRIGVCACLVGVADGMVRAAFLSSNNLSISVFLQWPLAGAGLLTMVIVYAAALLSSEQSTRTIYKAAIFVMAFFFMLLPVFTGAQDVESVLALAGYGTFNVLIWMLLAEISSNYRLSSTEVFGIGWGMVALGVLLGSIAGSVVDRFAPFSPQFLSLIALIATMAVLLSYLFVFRESDLIALTEEPGSEAKPGPSPTTEEPGGLGGEAPAGETAEEAGRPAADGGVAAGAGTFPARTGGAATSGRTGAPRPRFQDRCLEVAAAFELSPKETEVMILFAKGRSATRIQEELFISKGTVSTHLRHIYQKMDVHSKQEMLDLIEGVIRE